MSELAITNLTKYFPSVTACDNITFTIYKNEFFFFLGPSGCGKTTLLKIIAGLLTQDSGSIHLQGKCIDSLPPYQRDVNTVFQHYALFPHLNIFDNVAFGLKMKRLPASEIHHKVTEMLNIVELKGYENRKPNQLSGGQQQRVALARALVNHPSVLLLDEPLGALDVKLRKQMQLELKHLQKKMGITFICVTHDQDEALTMADRIAVMNHGKFEQVGTPEEIYSHPKTKFVAEFIGDNNYFRGENIEFTSNRISLKLNAHETIIAKCHSSAEPGKNILFSVRPEKIYLLNGNHTDIPSQNHIQGDISEIIYMGNNLSYVVKTNSGQLVKILEQNYSNSSKHKEGDKVHLVWDIDNTMLIEE